jgi:hypothetical protein
VDLKVRRALETVVGSRRLRSGEVGVVHAHSGIPDTLECLADLAVKADGHREAARLFGAADAIRQRIGVVRFKIYDVEYQNSLGALRDAMGEEDFAAAWAEGTALSTDEALAYAQRGRGGRKRPSSGWASLTPPSTTWYDSSARGSPTKTSQQGFSSQHAPCKPTSPTSTPNSASPPVRNSPEKQPATPD